MSQANPNTTANISPPVYASKKDEPGGVAQQPSVQANGGGAPGNDNNSSENSNNNNNTPQVARKNETSNIQPLPNAYVLPPGSVVMVDADLLTEQYRAEMRMRCEQGLHEPKIQFGLCGIIGAVGCFVCASIQNGNVRAAVGGCSRALQEGFHYLKKTVPSLRPFERLVGWTAGVNYVEVKYTQDPDIFSNRN